MEDPATMLKNREKNPEPSTEEDTSSGFFSSLFSSGIKKRRSKKQKILEEKAARQLEVDESPFTPSDSLKGIYLYGSPGCGKTFLMDLFYTESECKSKRRVHFNEFMLNIHQMNHRARKLGLQDSLFHTATEIAKSSRLLCLDEFQVTDIGDAVIMKRLFEIMWQHRLVLVTTSNRAPEELYKNGIQREVFEPFIPLLQTRCQEVKYR